MANNNTEALEQPTDSSITRNHGREMTASIETNSDFGNFTSQRRLQSRVARHIRRDDNASEELVHLEPHRSGNTILPVESSSEFENFTSQRRQQLRDSRRTENLSNLSVDLDDLEPLATEDLDHVINEANKDRLTSFDLPSPSTSTSPSREPSPESEASSTQQGSSTVSPSISQHTQDEDNLSDVDADLDDLVSLDDGNDREQVINMVDEAERLAENPNHVPLGMTPEPEYEGRSRPALAPISHQSDRLQEEANRPRPAFPNYLMDEYLEHASNFGRDNNRQTFTERHRENIWTRTEPDTTTTTTPATNNNDVDGTDSWIDLEPLSESLPAVPRVTPLRPTTRLRAGFAQASRHLLPVQGAVVFRSFR